MKIDNNMAQQAYAAYRSKVDPARGGASQQTSDTAATSQQPDTVEISAKSRQYAQALDAVRNSPPTREALVASLRSQVQNGTYQVNHQKLANAIAQRVDVRA